MTTLPAIKQQLSNLKPELHQRFGVSEIGVFGSWVRGEQKETSDIDVLVDFDRPITLFKIFDLQEYLKVALDPRVDLVLKSALKEKIGKQILKEVQYL